MTDCEAALRLWREALARARHTRDAVPDQMAEESEWLARGLERWWKAELDSTSEDSGDTQTGGTSVEQPGPHYLFEDSPFSRLADDTVDDLLPFMHLQESAPGDYLIKQGDPAEFLLCILSGYADARTHDAPADRAPIGTFGPGDIVGEISLVTDEPRTADVVARSAVCALRLSSVDFHAVASRHPDLRVVLTDVVAQRLGQASYDGLGGKEIHGYRIVRCVGRGGMGIVYDATEVATHARVALKMMNHRLIYDLNAVRRFEREAALLKTLQHPALARLYDRFSAYKTEFLAIEFCDGQPLNQLLATSGRLTERNVRRLVGQLAAALKHVHDRGVLHRDLKPANIMLAPDGTIKLLDFGIAAFARGYDLPHSPLTTLGHGFLGTPRYMAPELFHGRGADRRADFYSLSCVAFEALSGRPVISSSELFDIVREHERFVLPPDGEIAQGLSTEMYDMLRSGLEHDPDKRSLDLAGLAAWATPLTLDEE
jgi:tRNA A-37 threonylcarbamoyl transferase component Bud32